MQKAINKIPHIYESLAALFITTLIVSNIASVKIVELGPLVFDAGTILFPLAYIIGDIITEIYGFKKMRRLVFIGVIMLIITSLTFWIVGALPATSDWTGHGAYSTILGVVPRIVLASITAILIGEILNAYVLAKLKIRSQGKDLWQRIIGSSVVGNAVDTSIFSVIAFAGVVPGSVLLSIIATVFSIKMTTELILSPLTVRIITAVKQREELDVYEEPTFGFRD